MKRSLVIIGATCSMSLIPVYAQAVSPSPVSLVTATAPTTSTPNPISKKVVHQAFLAAMEQAQNGSDLAFADAKATLMLSISGAGKDRIARKAAHDAYKTAVTAITSAYKQAITQARQAYKAALVSKTGK